MKKLTRKTLVECFFCGDAQLRGIALEQLQAVDGDMLGVLPAHGSTRMGIGCIMELYHSGDSLLESKAKEQCVLSYGRFMRHIIHSHAASFAQAHMDDLYQCAVIGLLKAMECYDGSHAFTTYSKFFIIHEISAYTRFVQCVGTPHYARIQKAVSDAKGLLESRGIPATVNAIATLAGLDEAVVSRELAAMRRASHVSIEQLGEDAVDALGFSSPWEAADTRLALDEVALACRELGRNTRRAVYLHAVEKMPYAEMAAEMGMDVEQVSRLYKDGIHYLRAKLGCMKF